MGPRLFSRGNAMSLQRNLMRRSGFNGAATLQSRKSRAIKLDVNANGVASMGPRLFSRGNTATTGSC